MLLSDPEWRGWGDREIARRCGVHFNFVAKVRGEVTITPNDSEPAERTYTTKHGTQAQMRTGNIGRRAEPAPERPTPASPIRSTVGESIRTAPAGPTPLEQRHIGMRSTVSTGCWRQPSSGPTCDPRHR